MRWSPEITWSRSINDHRNSNDLWGHVIELGLAARDPVDFLL